MSDKDKLYRIKEVAEMLGVSTRTVYRRIWANELTSIKIGGLIYVRQEDLEKILNQSPASLHKTETDIPKIIKCGSCLKILKNTSEIARRCSSPGCVEVICTSCATAGKTKCRSHQGFTEAINLRKKSKPEGPIKVRAGQARLLEVNYLNRLRSRMRRIESIAHPVSGSLLSIPDWEAILKTGDDRAEVLRLKGKVLLDSREASEQPLNAWLQYVYKPQANEQDSGLIIEIRVISRLDLMVGAGFDSWPLDEEDLEQSLIQISDAMPSDGSFKLHVLASPTGWTEAAKRIVTGSEDQQAFASEDFLAYLFDMQSNKLIYPLNELRSVQYAELFNPSLLSEEAQDAEIEIEGLMLSKGHSSLTLITAKNELPFSELVLMESFKRMANKGNYRLVELEDLGPAIQKI